MRVIVLPSLSVGEPDMECSQIWFSEPCGATQRPGGTELRCSQSKARSGEKSPPLADPGVGQGVWISPKSRHAQKAALNSTASTESGMLSTMDLAPSGQDSRPCRQERSRRLENATSSKH